MSIPAGMKAFDIEKALAGEPVVTRDGQEVKQFTKYDINEGRWNCRAVLNGNIRVFDEKGESQYTNGLTDLFMKSKTKVIEAWVNVYPDGFGQATYKTEEEANQIGIATEKCIKQMKITCEIEV